jgi:uncharacterized lipoprotein YbaY
MSRFRLVAAVVGLAVFLHPGGGSLNAQGRQRDRDRDDRVDRKGEDARDDSPLQRPQLIPPPLDRGDRFRRWRLGVQVAYRDYGAQVTYVERRSPASRAGLEARDVIVTVNGYQVGHVLGRLYSLDRELELRADRFGRVLLLVQNRRNGSLANIDVRLEPADRVPEPPRVQPLIGIISSRRVTQLPREATLVVQLVDITDRLSPLRPIAQRTYRDLGPLPIPFELDYDPDRIEAKRQYALRAHVAFGGLIAYQTRETYRVLADKRQGRVNMVLERAR